MDWRQLMAVIPGQRVEAVFFWEKIDRRRKWLEEVMK